MKELKTPLSLSELLSYHDKVAPFFMDKWELITKNERKMLADNWTDAQKQKIKEKGAQPFSMPLTLSSLNIIISTQRQARQSWKVEASSDPNDEIPAEIATITMRDYERKQNMAYLESDVFGKGVGVSFGADKFEVVNKLGKDTITNRPVDILNLVWDLNDTSYGVENPTFIAEIEKTTARALKADGIDIDRADNTTGSLEGRTGYDYYGIGEGEDRTVALFHHYHEAVKKYYIVLFKDSQNLFNFPDVVIKKTRSKKEAEDLVKSISVFYGMTGLDPSDEISIETEEVTEYDYYKFTYNKMIEYKETGETFHPYNLYFAIREANDWISVTDMVASPQLFIDRLWSQIDRSLASELKNVYELNVHALAEGETTESVVNKVMRNGGVIFKDSPEKVLDVADTKGFNPQYIQVIDIMGMEISKMMGGANSQGLKESSAESGRAVALRQEQGKLVAFLFLDNLTRYKKLKGDKLLALIKKYDTTERIIKIIGGDLDEQMLMFLQQSGNLQPSMNSENSYLTINQGVTAFQSAELDLVIDTAPMNAYERASKLDQYTTAEQNMPALLESPTWQEEKLNLLDIPKATANKVIQEMRMIQQMQMQMQMAEINNQKADSVNKVAKAKSE